jgi:IS5 family transposase
MGQLSIFTVEDRYTAISKCGDPLEKLEKVIPWEDFRPLLKHALKKERKSEAGRPPFDYVMMLKVLVLQSLYNLSDDQMEFQIRDRLSFVRFLGLSLEGTVPDAKTIWHYREMLTNAGVIRRVFNKFDRYLQAQGFRAKKGQLIDATIVEVPKQGMTEKERDQVEAGETPKDWQEKPAMLSQKDTDARWTKKHAKSYYGYKNHVNVDGKHKLIREYTVTSANVHDSRVMDKLITPDENSKAIYADSAYRSRQREKRLRTEGYRSHICTKGRRDNKLSKFQKALNKRRARIRARVEHVFGAMSQGMAAYLIRCIGKVRAAARIGLNNLTYNMRRYCYLAAAA